MQRLYLAVVQKIFCGISVEACMILVEGLARFSPYLHSGPGLASRVSTSGFLVATVTQSKPINWQKAKTLSCEDAALTHTPSMTDQVQKYVTILLSDKNPLRFGRCVMQKRFEKLNSFKSQFDFGIVHKRSCPSPPQSKWITIVCWCPSTSRSDRTTTTTHDDDFDPLACHANHHLNAKTVLGCCAEYFLWHFFGGLHDFRRGTCAFFAVSTLRSRVSLKSVHIRFSCRDRDPIKPINWQKAKTLSCVWVCH